MKRKRRYRCGFKGERDETVKRPAFKISKSALRKASPSIVSLTTHQIPDEMIPPDYDGWDRERFVFRGHGIVIHCDQQPGLDASYTATILAPAVLFQRIPHIQPQHIKCDVFASDGELYQGQLLVCDFHYNLAAINIQLLSPLQPAALRALNDVSSIDVCDYDSSLLAPHSNLFKVQPGRTQLITLQSSFSNPFEIYTACAVFSASHVFPYSCKELYWVKHIGTQDLHTGAAINQSGEVVGIMHYKSAFLPSNFILRWWNNYNTHGKLCRPWVGLEIANLAEARLGFLEKLRNKFPDIGAGVIVTKVEKDTPAYCLGIRPKDVIVKCDGKHVKSKIEFFESMWDNAGKFMELTLIRASDSILCNRSMTIGETSPDNFYRWKLPYIATLGKQSTDKTAYTKRLGWHIA